MINDDDDEEEVGQCKKGKKDVQDKGRGEKVLFGRKARRQKQKKLQKTRFRKQSRCCCDVHGAKFNEAMSLERGD